MTHRMWKTDAAERRIRDWLEEVRDVTIKDYVRDTDLGNLPTSCAYRVDGVHVYVDILNMEEMLAITGVEGVQSHQRTLRFLNLHYRAVARILAEVDAIRVDFHNQRLHAVIVKPYGDEAQRIHRAVAMSQLIIDVLRRTAEEGDDPLPAAIVRVGIDSGLALAVNNGRRGHREPLFLGCPANHAAKRAGGGVTPGTFLTNDARLAIGLAPVENEDGAALSADVIEQAQEYADLAVTAEGVLKAWQQDLDANPIGKFEFGAHTPPLAGLDLETLSPRNSRRQEALSIYADIDGFTKYVAENIDDDETAKDVVRVLHVLRSELNEVLVRDFQGLKIRFIGDCIHGVLAEGTAATTDIVASIENAVLCAGALRSSFDLAVGILCSDEEMACDLGLAIGMDLGPTSMTRLGVKGDMIRCGISRGVLASEAEQRGCSGTETAMGAMAHKKAPFWISEWFGDTRRRSGVTYVAAKAALDRATEAGKAARTAESLVRPATAVAASGGFTFPDRARIPTKPAGFA